MNHFQLGYTGTRAGRTEQQAEATALFMAGREPSVLHHGDCVGGDEQTHENATEYNWGIVVHPPIDDRYRAYVDKTYDYELVRVLPELPYLERNMRIVDASHMLLANPKQSYETNRSGTWWTVRYARHVHKPIIVVWPNGNVTAEVGGGSAHYEDMETYLRTDRHWKQA